MIWASINVADPGHGYSGHFNFIILFVVVILPLYAINFDVMSFSQFHPLRF
jgi:hypothetical protein